MSASFGPLLYWSISVIESGGGVVDGSRIVDAFLACHMSHVIQIVLTNLSVHIRIRSLSMFHVFPLNSHLQVQFPLVIIFF